MTGDPLREREGAGGEVPPSAGPTGHVAPVLLVAQNVSRIAGLAGGLADGLQIVWNDADIGGAIRVLREIQSLADALLPSSALPSARGVPDAEQSLPNSGPGEEG